MRRETRRWVRSRTGRVRATLGVGAALTLVVACGGDDSPGAAEVAEPVEVEVSRVVTASAATWEPATVVADRRAVLSTRTSGRIDELRVDVGSAVAAGQTLVRLDGTDVRARLEGAEAEAGLARRYHERLERLAADGAVSDQEMDEARSRLEGAEAAVREARAQLDYVVVRAPFAGVVATRSADPGDLAVPGRPILTLVDATAVHVEADLPSSAAGRVAVGDTVGVVLPDHEWRATAVIRRVAPSLREGSRRLRVEASLDPDGTPSSLLPGAFARLEIPGIGGPGSGSSWIPDDAVVRRGQLTGVFTVEDDSLRLRWLRLGRERDGAVEVLAGPAELTAVVREPGPDARDGAPVRALRERPWSLPDAVGGGGSR